MNSGVGRDRGGTGVAHEPSSRELESGPDIISTALDWAGTPHWRQNAGVRVG
jgi:hypothetical protein